MSEEKPSFFDNIKEAIIEKIRGKSIRRHLAFLLNPESIETSSRLSRNQVLAVNMADWLGLNFKCFKPLRDFWVGLDGYDLENLPDRGSGFARWVTSEGGKRIEEAIGFMQATRESTVITPIMQAFKGEKKRE